MELDLSASVDPLYAQLGSMSDWNAVLPAVSGLEFWSAATGGTQITSIDDSFPSSGQYDRKVWVSIDPASAATINVDQIAFTVDPDGADVTSTDRVEEVSGWTRSSWTGSPATSVYSGTATSHGNDCTLRQLAEDITGNAGDYWLLRKANPGVTINPKTTAVPNDTTLDISPLLVKLEQNLRANVVKAANAHKFAHFPVGTESYSDGTDLDEDAVNQVFTGGNAAFECWGMANVEMARGLISTLEPGEFDALFGTTGSLPLVSSTVALNNTKLGDWLYFANDPTYLNENRHPNGDYQGENVIKNLAPPQANLATYWGWGGDPPQKTYDAWCAELVKQYNSGLPAADQITTVPGYTGTAQFFDVATLAEDVFDHRSTTTD